VPVAISIAVIPIDQISHLKSYELLIRISGAIQQGVPTILDIFETESLI